MRRMVLFVTVALVMAAMIAADAFPTFAKQAKTKEGGQAVGAGTCATGSDSSYPTIQSAVDDPSCQTIQLGGPAVSAYLESVTIDRNLTITGSGEDIPPVVGGESGESVFTILPGKTVTFEDFHIDSGGGASVEQGGGIHNQGTLVLDGVTVRTSSATGDGGGIYNQGTLTIDGGEVFSNTATGDGGGIYNQGTLTLNGTLVSSNVASGEGGGVYNAGTLYLCGTTTFIGNEAPPGTEDDISGTPAQQCPTGPPGGGGPPEGNRVLVDHRGKKELCLPTAALKAHLKHGDEVLNEEGCSDDPAAKKNGKHGRGGARGGK